MAEKLSTPAPSPPPRPRLVGVVHSPGSLRAALSLSENGPDLLELRVDVFAAAPAALDELLLAAPRPFLLTVRDPREGGADSALTPARRRELFERFLPAAALVDIELRALAHPALAAVAAAARARGVPVVASFHDFEKTPAPARLRALARRARELGADIFKAATRVRAPADLAHLLLLLDAAPLSVAAMGMGENLGRASRLVLAAAGSVLNYGYLDDDDGSAGAVVPGQWSVARLRERLEELKDEG